MDSQPDESGIVLLLTAAERAALVRVLRVVQDNWWLDELEGALLTRLELAEAVFAPAA